MRVYVEHSATCPGGVFEDDFYAHRDFGFYYLRIRRAAEVQVEFICGGGYEPADGVCHVAPD